MAAPNFNEWLPKQTFMITKENAEKLIDAFLNYNRDRLHCDICGKELTIIERSNIQPQNFNYTCKEHERYANAYQVEELRSQFGYNSIIKKFFL